MTSFHHPPSVTGPLDDPVLQVRDPGELIAAVPVLLGFHPRESLVLLSMAGSTGRRLGLTLRVDLPPAAQAAALCRRAVDGLLLDDPAGAVVIVFAAGRAGSRAPHRELVDRLVRLLEGHRIDVHALLWAASTSGGAPWACYRPCGCSGVLPDPSATPLAAAAAVQGRVVRPDRGELERSVAAADAGRIRRREERLVRSVEEELSRPDIGADAVEGEWAEAGRRLVDAALADAAAGRLGLDDERVVALATALAVPAVRHAALLRCAGRSGAAAEQLWAALVRETPDPEAAEPAALLAVSALLRGDGALANVALDRAERSWPGHRLTAVVRSMADAGVSPTQLAARIREGITAPVAVDGEQRAHRRTMPGTGRAR